ncbi:BRO-N domain-containing protein [Peribacillus frigoritolerans]|uniref:BRO-N domain-containing protein n=1 Tax=Peribacillus frigoritolerans TaxID=450367 RepID=UPI0037F2C3FA
MQQQEVLGQEFKDYGNAENPIFLAKDIAEWIEHNKPSEMIRSVDTDEKLMSIITLAVQNSEMWFLTEDELYELLMHSRKPIAKAFKQEVKTIRKDGGYIPTNEVNDDVVTIMAKALVVALKTIERKSQQLELANKVIEEQKTMVRNHKNQPLKEG